MIKCIEHKPKKIFKSPRMWELGFIKIVVAGFRGQYVRPGERHGHYHPSFSQILRSQVQAEESRAKSAYQQ